MNERVCMGTAKTASAEGLAWMVHPHTGHHVRRIVRKVIPRLVGFRGLLHCLYTIGVPRRVESVAWPA